MLTPPVPAAAIAHARDAARSYLRCAGDADDAVLATLAAAAIETAEAFTGCALIAREWQETLAGTGAAAGRGWQRLARAPVAAIVAVEQLEPGSEAVALAPGAYAINIDRQGDGLVRVAATAAAPLRVTYRAGLAADWDALPAALAQGVVVLIAHGFDARTAALPPPAAVRALWLPWRRMRLGLCAA